MDPTSLQLRRLVERAMRGGGLPLSLLLEVLVPVARMRALAKELGLQPKGGFRLEKAPAKVVAELLAERQLPAEVDRVVGLLAQPMAQRTALPAASSPGEPKSSGPVRDKPKGEGVSPIVRLKEQELTQVRAELERARASNLRGHEREEELRCEIEQLTVQAQRLRAELAEAQRRAGVTPPAPPAGHRESAQRIRDLEQELAGFVEADEGLRRQLAVERSRVRELEEELREVLPLVPKGRRRRRPPPEPPPEPARRFLLPHFDPAFYRSLEGKDRKSVERAFHAILQFCTEGHAYPGLEVKQMGGQDTWSLRASLGLRVYFRQRDGGDVVFLELADREEQRTTLRRLKER